MKPLTRSLNVFRVLPMLGVLIGISAHAADPVPGSARDLSGVWWANAIPATLKPIGETSPPLTAAGRQQYERTRVSTREVAAGPKNKRDVARCESFGVPRIWLQPFPFKIVQKGDTTTILYEHNRVYRIVKMAVQLPTLDMADPAYMGHSVGRWEGNDLLIETGLFKTRTVLDDTGLPHSDQLRVTERLRKSADGKSLSLDVTITDPPMYTKPWKVSMSLPRAASDVQLEDYICGWGQFDTRQTRAATRS